MQKEIFSTKQIKAKMKCLIDKLKKFNYEYYILNYPSVSDEEYDEVLSKLKLLEQEYPDLIYKNTSTKQIGSKIDDTIFTKIKHKNLMYSLDNAFTFEELKKFEIKNLKILDKEVENLDYMCEIKIDGLSLNLLYSEGVLKKCTTRGDGNIGEGITDNIINNRHIPLKIDYFGTLEIRGEVIFNKESFVQYKNEIIQLNKEINLFNKDNENKTKLKDLPLNSRNATSGLVRNKYLQEQVNSKNIFSQKYAKIKSKYLNELMFFAYNVPDWEAIKVYNQLDLLEFLKNNNFCVFEINKYCSSLFEVENFLNEYKTKLKKLSVDADGIVIKINDFKVQDKLSFTEKSPRWAIAYKFKAISGISRIKNIFITIGRTGKVTYNAKIKPVFLEGSTINFVTLHNYNYVKNLDLRLGSNIEIIKSGGVIPKILRTIDNDPLTAAKPFLRIINCPSCDSLLVTEEEEVDDYCVNIDCPDIIKYAILHYCQKEAMNIDSLGEKLIEKLLNSKVIVNITNIYELVENNDKGSELQQKFLESITIRKNNEKLFVENSIILQKIILNIKKSKLNSLEKLIFGLNIRHVGEKNSLIVAQTYTTLELLSKATFADLSAIKEVGPRIAESLVNFFSNPLNKKLVIFLENNNIANKYLTKKKTLNTKHPFYNKTFLITGEFSENRSTLIEKIKYFGGIPVSSVSKNVSFLITGEHPGSKLEKVLAINKKIETIQIINSNDLEKLLILK